MQKAVKSVAAWILMSISVPGLMALEGKIVSAVDRQPISEAAVSIVGLSGSVTTGRDGRFIWLPDPPLPFEVIVVLPDGRYMAPVLVESVEGDLLIVEVEPLLADSLTVSAAVTPNIEAPPANGMTTVAHRELVEKSPARLTDALQTIPGVGQISEGHAAVPTIRGLARGRTLILVDDARVTTERRAGPSATFLDPFFLEGVEVARGPGSVAYGSDAFGGIIHARTRRPEAGAPLRMRFRGSLGAGLPEKSASLELSTGIGDGGLIFQGRYRDFDDYRSRRGDVDNSAASDRGFLLRFQKQVSDGIFSVGWLSDWGRTIGRPSTRNESLRIFYPEETSHRFTIGYDSSPKAGFSRIGFNGFLGGYELVTRRDRLPTSESDRTITESDVSAMDYGFRGVATRPLGSGKLEFGVDLNGRFGLEAVNRLQEFNLQDSPTTGAEVSAIDDARQNNAGFFLTGETALAEWINANAGVRYDRISTNNDGGLAGDSETTDGAVSGFASLTAMPGAGFSLTGQIARGFRVPTLSDRYFTGVSGRGFISGNPDLQPETSIQYDFALRHTSRHFRWGVFGYWYRIDDLIERYESSEDFFEFRNRSRARIKGLEIETQAVLTDSLTLDAGAQIASGELPDDDTPLDDIPQTSFTVGLNKQLSDRGYLNFRGVLFSRDDDSGPTEISLPGYGFVNIGGGWKLAPRVELRFLVRNLFDKDFPASPDSRALGAPGRSGQVTLYFEVE